MKKLLSYTAIVMLAAMVMTSCGKKQAETQTDVPLKVTYSIDCSRDLLNLCDMVVTYKGDDGANVVDTITADPDDSATTQTWSKTVGTHQIPVKIGLDYTFVPKTDTLITDQPTAMLSAKCTIIAEKMGIVNGIRIPNTKVINSKRNFYMENWLINEKVANTKQNLATIIDIYNDRQAYKRGTAENNTCFNITPSTKNSNLKVKTTCWNDDADKAAGESQAEKQ